MASITKRGTAWRAQVKHNGQRYTKSFRLKGDAIAWSQELEKTLERQDFNKEQHTLADALDRYAAEESPKKRGERWEKIRLAKLKLTMGFANKDLRAITAADIAEWRDSQTIAPASVRREMVLLSSVFRVAVTEWKWLSSSPMSGVRKPPSSRPRDRIFTDQEINLICDNLTGPMGQQVAVLFRLAVETAMRSGELVSLTWDQVDLKRRVVHLDKTKNGDRRDVPLSPPAVELFDSLRPGTGRVFALSPHSRDALWRRARDLAGLRGATFHDSRATALTRLSKKVDVLTLARIAGHRDLKSLQVYYREPAEEIALRL